MKFQYIDDEIRDYNAYGRVEKGTVVDAPEAPDHRWTPVTAKKEKASDAS